MPGLPKICFILIVLDFFCFSALSFIPTSKVTWNSCPKFTDTNRQPSANDGFSFLSATSSRDNPLSMRNIFPGLSHYLSEKQISLVGRPFSPIMPKSTLNNPIFKEIEEDVENLSNSAKFWTKQDTFSTIKSLGSLPKVFSTLGRIEKAFASHYQRKQREINQPRTSSDDILFSGFECGKIQVPANWDVPSSTRFVYSFVKRMKAKKPAKGSIFFLQGGPGGSSTVFETYASDLMEEFGSEWDLILIDHRGTGRSSPLKCQTSYNPSEVDNCYSKMMSAPNFGLDGIAAFSTTNAAKDLLFWADLLRDEKGKNHTIAAYSASYGTYWLNRAMQLAPEKIDIAIVDSTVTPGSFDFADWDQHYTEIGTNFLKECTTNARCSALFEQDFGKTENSVNNAIYAAYEKLNEKDKKCEVFMDNNWLRQFNALALSAPSTRKFIIPAMKRVLRCSYVDRKWLDNLFILGSFFLKVQPPNINGNMTMVAPPKARSQELQDEKKGMMEHFEKLTRPIVTHLKSFLMSFMGSDNENLFTHLPTTDNEGVFKESLSLSTYTNIVCSEMMGWDTMAEKSRVYNDFYVHSIPPYFFANMGNTLISMCRDGMQRSRIYDEPLKTNISTFMNPMLILTGTLDTQTPPSYNYAWRDHFQQRVHNPYAFMIEAKNAFHGVAFSTKTDDETVPYAGMRIIRDFLNNPKVAPDTSVLKKFTEYELNFFPTLSLENIDILLFTVWPDLFEGGPFLSLVDLLFIAIFILIVVIIISIPICCCCCCCCCTICCGILGLLLVFCAACCGFTISCYSACCCCCAVKKKITKNKKKQKLRKQQKKAKDMKEMKESLIGKERLLVDANEGDEDDDGIQSEDTNSSSNDYRPPPIEELGVVAPPARVVMEIQQQTTAIAPDEASTQ